MDDDFQYPIETIFRFGRQYYTYKCNGCGKEITRYIHRRVKGKIWCGKCYKQNQKNYVKSVMTNHDEEIRSAEREKAADERASLLAFICKKYSIPLLEMNCTVDEWEQKGISKNG